MMPMAHNRIASLTGYIAAGERFVTCPNQDVVYGAGYFDLSKQPIVFQVPDFGDRFWVYAFWDARTDEFSNIGKQYATKPGFYMMVGPNWTGNPPPGITAVVRSPTMNTVLAATRTFLDDTPEDHGAIQSVLGQISFYPLSEYDGKMKSTDWSKLPSYPAPPSKGETRWVNPDTFFDELPTVMKQVPPLPGEEALYAWIGSVVEAAAKDPEIKKTLIEAAVEAEREMITPLFRWRYNGRSAGNGWTSPVNGAEWGTESFLTLPTGTNPRTDRPPLASRHFRMARGRRGRWPDEL
jgi:hypothetical protein